METSWKKPQRTGLIDKYINLWKTLGFDFNGDTSNSQKIEGGLYERLRLQFAARKINAELEGKRYEIANAVKIVHAKEKRFWIVKFNMRDYLTNEIKTVEAFILFGPSGDELLEWRFKDGPPETPPPTYPCVEIPPVPETSTSPPPPRAKIPESCSHLTNEFSALSTSGTSSPMVSDGECECPVDEDKDDFEFPIDEDEDEDGFEFPIDENEADGDLELDY